jgi:hypothetical protein
MPLFTFGRSAFSASTSADSITIASSNNPLRILIADVKGLGTSSSANEMLLFRGTSVGSSGAGSAITPSKVNSGSAAAAFAVYTSFASTTQSTAGEVLWRFGANGNGGQDKFTALPGAELQVPRNGYVCFRAAQGQGSLQCNFMVEEVDG